MCPAQTTKGPCRVPSLRGDPSGACFNHSPLAAERRAAARRRGGHARAIAIAERKARAPAAPPAGATGGGGLRSVEPFELGALADVGQIADAMTRLAQVIASSAMPVGRARLLLEVLRGAREATYEARGGASAHGGREMTDEELRYVATHEGRLPPNVVSREPPGAWKVEGPIWVNPEAAAEPEEPAERPVRPPLKFPGHDAPDYGWPRPAAAGDPDAA